jgi:flagella basal body P-ring formation protein FlgA
MPKPKTPVTAGAAYFCGGLSGNLLPLRTGLRQSGNPRLPLRFTARDRPVSIDGHCSIYLRRPLCPFTQDIPVTRLSLSALALCASLLLSAVTQADTSAAAVENSARDYLTQLYRQQNPAAQIDVHINPVSTRLRLPDCAAPLTVEAPRGSGSRITTRVACDGPQHWALFVTAKVGILHQVMITRRPVGRGEVLGNDDIESRLLDISDETRGYYLAPEDVIGRSASRHLPNASILNAGMLTNSTLIERGDSVIIEVRTGAMLLRAQGTALEDGEDGAQIRVRNDRSGQEIKALVVARGLVRPLTR